MMSRKPDALREPAEVLKAFKLFEIPAIDKEKAGYVRQSSLIHALSNLSGEKLSRSEATELLSQMPAPDEQGFINYSGCKPKAGGTTELSLIADCFR